METENLYTHNFHPYAAKFPPYAIRSLIEKYTKSYDNVLDPFCGSGTSLVECLLLCRNATGVELNPVGKLISETKAAYYSKEDIELTLKAISKLKENCLEINSWLNSFSNEDILPNHPNKEFWFKPHVLKELYGIKTTIDQYGKNPKVYNLLLTGFSRIVVPVSNQESETRYKAIEKNLPLGHALRLYIKTIEGYIDSLKKANLDDTKCHVQIQVVEGDAREQVKQLQTKFDFAITSPPYINSYDYYLYHKHRIFWLSKNPRVVRKLEIGNHHKVDTQTYENATDEYEDSMLKVFQGVNSVLRLNAHFALLIGDGIVKGKKMLADELIAKIAKRSGFELTSTMSIPLKEVSKRFIKEKSREGKLHHVMVLCKVTDLA
jgi:site-specific DNA-methyltransferase (cytosine-N4-specific)